MIFTNQVRLGLWRFIWVITILLGQGVTVSVFGMGQMDLGAWNKLLARLAGFLFLKESESHVKSLLLIRFAPIH